LDTEDVLMTCHGVIPDTFIACGEEGLYCSDECLLRAEVERLTRERDAFMRDAAHEMQVSRELHEECERLRADVAHWERKEIDRATCCYENEKRARLAESALLDALTLLGRLAPEPRTVRDGNLADERNHVIASGWQVLRTNNPKGT